MYETTYLHIRQRFRCQLLRFGIRLTIHVVILTTRIIPRFPTANLKIDELHTTKITSESPTSSIAG